MAAGDFFVRRWEALKNKQIWGRIGQIVLVLLGISFVTFALVMLSPGDPVRQMIAGNEDIVVSQVEIDALRHELGLDKPFIFQYLDWLGRAVQGDFGFSYMVKKPVVEELMQSLPATLILALASTLFMLVFSLPLGIYSVMKILHTTKKREYDFL
jgi:peptide/nickel transport system permease protein